ncbi:MAG: hypothetical protein ACTS73_09080 [Arsenophonus sp. NEOnobi-MAG3]
MLALQSSFIKRVAEQLEAEDDYNLIEDYYHSKEVFIRYLKIANTLLSRDFGYIVVTEMICSDGQFLNCSGLKERRQQKLTDIEYWVTYQ